MQNEMYGALSNEMYGEKEISSCRVPRPCVDFKLPITNAKATWEMCSPHGKCREYNAQFTMRIPHGKGEGQI